MVGALHLVLLLRVLLVVEVLLLLLVVVVEGGGGVQVVVVVGRGLGRRREGGEGASEGRGLGWLRGRPGGLGGARG